MGIFGKRGSQIVNPVDTELDDNWFFAWADAVRQRLGLSQDLQWLTETYGKATQVINYDCQNYVQKYCEPWTHRAYEQYASSDEVTPWGLVALTVGCNATKADWPQFIISDMKHKLARFADIIVDPNIVT